MNNDYDQGREWALNRADYTPGEWAVIEGTLQWAEDEGLEGIADYHAGLLSGRQSTMQTPDGMTLSYE